MQLVLPYHNFIQEEMNRNEISLLHFQYHIKAFTAFPNIFHLKTFQNPRTISLPLF